MDNRTGEIDAFLRAADSGSFTAAAQALRVTPSAISRSVTRLETRLGVRLLQRSTRALALTVEGEAFYRRALALLNDLDELERSFATDTTEPRGKLRISASLPFGIHCLLPALPRFMAQYPKVIVDLSLSDTLVDLVDERTDVAIRHGPLHDSGLHARRLGSSRWMIVAAPSYLDRHGTPQTPDDLQRHNCLNFNFRRSIEGWTFREDGQSRQRAVSGTFLGNSGEALRLMALGGTGIARLAHFLVGEDVQAGRLVSVLDHCSPGDSEDIHALYAGHQRLATRVRAFVDFLVEQVSIKA